MNIKSFYTLLRKNTFITNWGALTLSSFAVQAVSMISSIRIASELAPSGYGEYSVVFVHVGFFGLIAAFGMRNVIIRIVSRNREYSQNIFNIAQILRIVTSIAAVLGLFIYHQFIDSSLSTLLFVLSICYLIVNTIFDTIDVVVIGLEKMTIAAWLNFIYTIIWVVLVYLLPHKYFSVNSLIILSVTLQALKTVTYYAVVKNKSLFVYGAEFLNKIDLSKKIISESLPYFWIALLTMGTNQMPMLFLFNRSGAAEVGLYNIAFKMLSPLQMVLANALNALFPRISAIAKESNERFDKMAHSAYSIMAVMSVFLAFPVTLFRNELVLLLYGKAYLESANIIAVQTWFFIYFAFVWLTGVMFGALDKQNLLSILTTVRTVFQIPLLWFASGYGAYMFSVAYVVGAIFDMLFHWYFLKQILGNRISTRMFVIIFFFLIGGMVVTMLIPQSLPLIFRVVILIGTCVAIYLYWKRYAQKEILSE